MKFDGERAIEWAQTLAVERLPWTSAGRRAARDVERAFVQSGYQVTRWVVTGSPSARNARIAWVWLGLGAWFSAALVLAVAGAPIVLRCGFLIAGFLWLGQVNSLFETFPALAGGSLRTWNVEAQRESGDDPPVRVVFVTTLDAPPPRERLRLRRIAGRFFGFICLILVVRTLHALPTGGIGERAAAIAFLAVFAMALAAWVVARIRPFVGEDPKENRDGLATLVEMARTWPRGTDRRIEARFVVAGGQLLDSAGLRALVRAIEVSWPRKRTLVIGLWSPALGPPFELGEGAVRPGISGESPLEPRPSTSGSRTRSFGVVPDLGIGRAGDSEIVTIAGGAKETPGREMRPESLVLAAQLATETALRWAKTAVAKDQEAGVSLERSSQNPG